MQLVNTDGLPPWSVCLKGWQQGRKLCISLVSQLPPVWRSLLALHLTFECYCINPRGLSFFLACFLAVCIELNMACSRLTINTVLHPGLSFAFALECAQSACYRV